MRMTIGRKIGLGFGLPVLMLLLLGVLSSRTINKLVETTSWVTHTYEVLEKSEHTMSLMKDVESGARAFALTGEEAFLDPYAHA